MERLNNKTLSFPALRFARVAATLAMVFALVACGKDGGGGGAPVAPIPPHGCVTCTGITSPVILTTFNTQSFPNPDMIFQGMQIFGDATLASPYNSGNAANSYSGPIAVQGTLVVTTNLVDPYSPCVIPAGTYYVQSNGVGQMSLGTLQIPSMITTSGAIEFMVDGMLYNAGQSFYGEIGVRRVNGMQCSADFYGVFGSDYAPY